MKRLFLILSLGLASTVWGQTTNDYPVGALKSAGYATPDSALETWTWAMANGDKKTMLQTLTPEARPEWEKLLTGMTDEQMKSQAAKGVAKQPGYTIVKRETISTNEVVIHLSLMGSKDVMKMDMKKIGNDWKVAGPKKD
jgi:hypothetical protein